MRVVPHQLEVLKLEFVNAFYLRVELHLRQGSRLASKLQVGLFEMIRVQVQVAEGMNENPGLQATNLRDHHRQQSIGGDVKRNPQEQIRASLVKLAAQFPVLHKKLKKGVTWR